MPSPNPRPSQLASPAGAWKVAEMSITLLGPARTGWLLQKNLPRR